MACSPSPNSTKFDSARTALGAVEDVVVFGRNSVRVEPSSAVLGGDIAVEATAGSPYPTSGTLADGARISVGAWSTIGGDVVAATGLFEYGSELVDGNNFDRYAALDGVFYNGLVRGGVSLPMSPPPPAFPTVAPVTPGIGTLTVAAGTSQTLTASTSYDAIVVETGATLYLETGAHRVATVTTSTNANVIALDRVDLRIADALVLGADSVLTATTGFSAGDLRVDVAGFNSPPDPLATVRAVDLGDRADVRAIVFAPNGTAWVGEDAVVDGVVFARDVWVDFGATVAFEDGRDPYASDAPVAFSDGYTVSEEETLSVSAPGVLWNDYDPNQDAIVAELVTGTNSGTVALSTDGSFSYTPQMDFTGSDSFTYRVFDGTYYSPTATVTFSVDDEADAPRIVSEPERFSFVGALWDYTVVATDADTNETFTYALESESPAAATVDSGGVVEWTPASGDEGANVVSIVVTDSDGLETAQVRGIEVTTSPRSEYFALYATESVQVAGGAIIKGDVGAVQSGSGTFLGSGWWGTARTTVGGYVDGDVFGDTVALDYNSSVDDVYTDDLVFDQGTSAEDTASLPSMEALAATATAAVSGALVVSTGTTQTLSAGAALATVEVEEDACLELEAGAHLFGSITVREGGCLVAQGPVSVRVNATLVLEDGAFIGPAPDVALDADQIQIQIHASNGGTGGPLDTPLPFDSGYASSVHAHVLAPNGTIRLGQSSSNRGSFRGLHVLADIESTITFEGDVDGSFGSAPYFTSTDVTTANVGAEYEYDADAFDADVGDVLTYFLDRRPDWMDIDRNTGEIIWVPRSNQGGDHLVELRVEDLAGNTAVRTFTIVVPLTNQAPSGVADFYRAYEGIPRTLTPAPTLNDDDPDNDLLDFVLMTQPANGTVTIESNGDVTYTSNAAFVGTDSFEYRARDPGGLESANTTVSITVFEANDPPVCVDRVYTVDEDTLLDVASVMGLTVGSSDPESDPVSVFVVSPPAHGTLTVSVDGAFTFLPDVEQTQQVTFDFICHDGRAFAAAPSTATINITPLNDAPLVDAGPDRTEPLGTMVALSGDAFDAEGDVMTFAWTFASVPSGSTAILTGADTPSPTFGTDELGTYNLTLTVTDANGAVDSDSVVITSAPLNRPPEIIEDPVPVARPGRAFNFPTNVNEPDGDTSLTYALVPEPSWLSPFSSTTGTLVGTPTANDLGSYPVTVTVTDPGGLSDTRSYTIEVVADAVPVAVDDTYDAFVDQSLTVAAASGVLANDSDADNDALTASVVTPPSTGSLTLGSDGSLTYDFALVSSSAITEKYHAYSGTGVISTPMVAHLTDDDGDGDIDQDDIPAIVFVTRPGGQFNGGAIVAIRGNDGQVLFTA